MHEIQILLPVMQTSNSMFQVNADSMSLKKNQYRMRGFFRIGHGAEIFKRSKTNVAGRNGIKNRSRLQFVESRSNAQFLCNPCVRVHTSLRPKVDAALPWVERNYNLFRIDCAKIAHYNSISRTYPRL